MFRVFVWLEWCFEPVEYRETKHILVPLVEKQNKDKKLQEIYIWILRGGGSAAPGFYDGDGTLNLSASRERSCTYKTNAHRTLFPIKGMA